MSRTDFFTSRLFKDINLDDPFFDSLKADYTEFEDWFIRKGNERAFLFEYDGGIHAFLYLKVEEEDHSSFAPPLPSKKRIKIGTLKIDSRGTRFGDRFIKKAIDYAVLNNTNELYVTVFPKHEHLIKLLQAYGFVKTATKTTQNGVEDVMVKSISQDNYDSSLTLRCNYPLIKRDVKSHLLSIWPEFHTRLFPDSILNTENPAQVIEDVSYSNSIEKVYICRMDNVLNIRPGDNIVIYRTAEKNKSAEYSAVATSLCVAVEVKTREDFANVEEVIDYCSKTSIFTDDEIRAEYFNTRRSMIIIKMLYCYALPKRPIRQKLINEALIDRGTYWGIIHLTEHQFGKILELGEVNESIIVN
ncbi:GNAT family N-acetyltransferase [Lysinibacillus tabacifolii]|uniref:GNAT family N-acetyltransferase n=1 Tax=Lysinibacillus tabacifolii TaxID=1173107 RepID=A0ABY2T424_9BACI|nr:GNAT family N-acetyltransferase [Lysinibacillus tabacifolii]TKI50561.1 GNAT family N-acetyltransferase [Lysinibacillus tabacifolii]